MSTTHAVLMWTQDMPPLISTEQKHVGKSRDATSQHLPLRKRQKQIWAGLGVSHFEPPTNKNAPRELSWSDGKFWPSHHLENIWNSRP